MRRSARRFQFNATIVISACLVTIFLFSQNFKFNNNSSVNKFSTKTTPINLLLEASVAPLRKHVTKSLAELGKMEEISKHVLLLNKVPNSGSELLVLLLEHLQGPNNFKHIKLKGNQNFLSESEEEEFVSHTFDLIRDQAIPLSLSRQVYFVNFTKYDRQSPSFINIIRQPADYLLSRFHHLKRSPKLKHLKTYNDIEKCILMDHPECSIKTGQRYNLNIAYFCGQDPKCQIINNDWSLKRAQQNVEKYYSSVGILEELNTTLSVLEYSLQYFFKGAGKLYHQDLQLNRLQQLPKRVKTPKSSQTFKNYMQLVLHKEYEFYQWITARLFNQMRRIYKKI